MSDNIAAAVAGKRKAESSLDNGGYGSAKKKIKVGGSSGVVTEDEQDKDEKEVGMAAAAPAAGPGTSYKGVVGGKQMVFEGADIEDDDDEEVIDSDDDDDGDAAEIATALAAAGE